MRKEFSNVFIDNSWTSTEQTIDVRNPYDNSLVGKAGYGDEQTMDLAISAAHTAFATMRTLPSYVIAEGLVKMRAYLEGNFEEIAFDISKEAGKPISLARIEVDRTLHTFEDGIEECKRMYGEILPLDRKPWGKNREGYIKRFPKGVIAAIAPFNFPLNLVAHKVVPALASKNTVVVRPATQTPFSSFHIAKAYENSGLPSGGLNVLPCTYAAADILNNDDRVKKITFTGSPKVGWGIKQRAYTKNVTLELGGNAPVIVHCDANLEKAARAIANGAFINAGQSCISAQRVFVHDSVVDAFIPLLKAATEELCVGDPSHPDTKVGPLISSKEVARVMEWINEAIAQGAKILTGGKYEGNIIYPTILLDTTDTMSVNCREVFGPVLTVRTYDSYESALIAANAADFGLQVGVFTQDIDRITQAYEILEYGGVIVNDVSTWRIDHMPYGGVKNSGVGREGVRFAMEEMTDMRLLVIAHEKDQQQPTK